MLAAAPNIESSPGFEVLPVAVVDPAVLSKLLRKSKTSLFDGLLIVYFVDGFSSKSSFSKPVAESLNS